jgi:hypothetical protein
MLLMIKISSPKYISGEWPFTIALIISNPGYIQDAIRYSFKKSHHIPCSLSKHTQMNSQ